VSACLGSSWLGSARLCPFRPGFTWLGTARPGSVRAGSARLGSASAWGGPGAARAGQGRVGEAGMLISGVKAYIPDRTEGKNKSSWLRLGSGLAWLGPGSAQLASACHDQGSSRLCTSRPGSAWLGLEWPGSVRAGSALLGLGSGSVVSGLGPHFGDAFFLSGFNQTGPDINMILKGWGRCPAAGVFNYYWPLLAPIMDRNSP